MISANIHDAENYDIFFSYMVNLSQSIRGFICVQEKIDERDGFHYKLMLLQVHEKQRRSKITFSEIDIDAKTV
jgi:hypothetical protein